MTLYEELMGTRSKKDPVKSLSAQKANGEGQMSDVLADARFRITLHARTHRRGEVQLDSVLAVLSGVQECRGEVSYRATILTADRGYGKPSFIDVINGTGMSSVSIMPEHLVSTHPFVGESRMDIARDDLLEGEVGFSGNDEGLMDGNGNGDTGEEATIMRKSLHMPVSTQA